MNSAIDQSTEYCRDRQDNDVSGPISAMDLLHQYQSQSMSFSWGSPHLDRITTCSSLMSASIYMLLGQPGSAKSQVSSPSFYASAKKNHCI